MECAKSFSITVDPAAPVGCLITDASPLPDQTGWENYSHQLTAAGGTAPYTFALIAGSITGGTVSAAGLIQSEFHNPNLIPAVSNFTIQATDSAAVPNVCNKAFQLTCQHATDCPDWTGIFWGAGAPFFTPDSASGDSFTGACGPAVAGGIHVGTIVFNTTDGCTMSELQWTWNVDAAATSVAKVVITSSLQGGILSRQKNAGAAGSETIKFGLQPGNHTITITLTISSNGGSTSMNGSIVN